MNILCFCTHYWPDITPYARLLKAIAERLAQEGHQVCVCTAQPRYNDVVQEKQPWREQLDGVDVVRFRLLPERKTMLVLRLLNFLLFLGQGVFYAFRHRKRFDLLVFNVHPGVLIGIAARLIKLLTGMPYICHHQDIHPEAFEEKLKSKTLYRLLRNIDTATCQHAALNIVLSEDMKDTLLDRQVKEGKIEVLNNFSLDTFYDGQSQLPAVMRDAPKDQFIVLFAGNLGDFQGLDEIVDAALLLSGNEQIRFVFMGEGSAKKRLMDRAGGALDKGILFVPQQTVEVAHAAMKRANLGVVSLAPSVFRYAFPSKTMMYLSAGCPILAVVESESQLARTVLELKLGCTCEQGNPEKTAAAIREAWEQRGSWSGRSRDRIRETAEGLFGRQAVLDRWTEIAAMMERRSSQQPHAINAISTARQFRSAETTTLKD